MNAREYWSQTVGSDWEHGMLMGNGSVGGLIFGTPAQHRYTFAHERVVLPTDPVRQAPNLAHDLPVFRSLIATGHAQEAAELGVERARTDGYPGLQWTDPLVPSATVVVDAPACHEWSDYRRSVDLTTSEVSFVWNSSGEPCAMKSFMSSADAVGVIELSGRLLSRSMISVERPANVVTTSSGVKGGNEAHVTSEVGKVCGIDFLQVRFLAEWEFSPAGSTTLVCVLERTTDHVLAVVEVVPGLRTTEEMERRAEELKSLPATYEELLERHVGSDGAQTNVAHLDLDTVVSGLPTEHLLASDDPAHQRELIELQYLATQATIAASTGELPPTLQGVWSGTFDPAWSSDYTMNGNVQNGSVAAALSGNNPRQLRVYLDMLEGFAEDFRENSRRLFGTDGYVLPSRCSPVHGKTTHFDAKHCHEFWTAGGAWAACSFLDYSWYTADIDYLRDHAYPFCREVERFYEGFLLEEDGRILFSPSYSPENDSPTFGSQACRNATMDRAALRQLLVGLLRAAEVLDLDGDLTARRKEWLAKLPPYRVAPDGTLAEWLDDGIEERLEHRTASQLFGLWYEADPVLVNERRFRDAVLALIEAKLAWRAGSSRLEEMSYGHVQLGVAAATVGDSRTAKECIDRMSSLYFLPSLATTTDVQEIFNVDICGGFPAVVNAMLVGSRIDGIDLLPALPPDWPTGSISGLAARGGITVDALTWSPDRVSVTVTAREGASRVRGTESLAISVPAGYSFEASGSNRYAATIEDGATLTLWAQAEVVSGSSR